MIALQWPFLVLDAVKNGNQTIGNAMTKVTTWTVNVNTHGTFASDNWTPTTAGLYMLFTSCGYTNASGCRTAIYKNGALAIGRYAAYTTRTYYSGRDTAWYTTAPVVLFANGSSDYISFYSAQGGYGNDTLLASNTFWRAILLARH